jgi:hypothetical protein
LSGQGEELQMLLTDDRLVDTMREYVMSANRLQYLSEKDHRDLGLLEQASEAHRQAATALQQALVSRGWRKPGT